MQKINNYISEKLHISKDLKKHPEYDEVTEDIINLIKDIEGISADIDYDEINEYIFKWIQQFEVKEVEYMISEKDWNTLKDESHMTTKYFDKLLVPQQWVIEEYKKKRYTGMWENNNVELSSTDDDLKYTSWFGNLYITAV